MGALNHIPSLAIEPNQPADPVQKYGQMQSVAALAAQRQQQAALDPGQLEMQRQQIQAASLENQQRIRQAAQVDAMNKAFQGSLTTDPATGQPKFDSGKVLSQVAASGNGSLVPQLTETFNKLDQNKATLLETKQKAASQLQDYMGSLGAEIKAAGYTPAAAGVALAHLSELDPQTAAQLRQQFSADPSSIQKVADAAIMASPKQQQAIKDAAQAGQADVETSIKQQQLEAGKQGGAVPGIPLDNQEANAWLKKNPGKDLADYAKYKATLVPAFNFNLQQGAGSNPLTPQQQATKTAILEGRMSPPGSFALKTPYWQSVMGGVFQDDPQWSEQRAQLRKSYTVGKQSTEINAINTAMGHVGVLGDAIDALNNGDIKTLNSIGNRLGIEFGSKTGNAAGMYQTIVHRVGPELSKAYIGAGGSAGERGADEKDFDPSLAPSILKANVGTTAQLLRSKIGSLENQWDQNKAPSMPSFQDHFISPEAKKQLDRWNPQGGGGNQGGITVTDPRGGNHTFPDQASADKFKKLANIQ